MLQCVSPYKSNLGAFQPGDMIDAPELIAALLADSPLSFEVVGKTPEEVFAAEDAAIVEPEQHRAIRRGRKA